jgi:ubiquinone/menaquinone biosynthesis C-methylase UbiE
MESTVETVEREIRDALSRASDTRLAFTEKALRMLPSLGAPRILDIGCGRGDPTLKLAALTDGEVVGLDINRRSLDELSKRVAELGLSGRVRAVLGSMVGMDFESESFDVIWAEASLHVVGFAAGLDEVWKFLKEGGFLVVHEMAWVRPNPPRELVEYWRNKHIAIRTVPEYSAEIPRHGYELIGHFTLPGDFWWSEYFKPLEHLVLELRERHKGDSEILRMLEQKEKEVDLHRKYSGWFGSAFFAMRKSS